MGIAIVDSGIDYRHPMLGGGGFPNDKVIAGIDTGDGDADPMAGDPHGTACAGIAAGTIGAVEDYIGGVAHCAKLYAVKHTFANTGASFTDSSLRAWDWCVTHYNDDPRYPIKVISNSWGLYLYPFTSRAAADAFSPAMTALARIATRQLGITIVAASGNDGFPLPGGGPGLSWPSAMSDLISVGALFDTTSVVTFYSNAADILDVLAPADPVYTTDIVGAGGYTPGDYFGFFNGTSSACPFVAGCVASIQSAARERVGRFLTPAEIRQLLIVTGDPVTDPRMPLIKPRVNLGAAVMSPYGAPYYVGKGCMINDWEAPDSDTHDAWDSVRWGTGARILESDPLFVAGYFLSQMAAGESTDSLAVDAGSVAANHPTRGFDPDLYSTRSDSVGDVNILDLGYHYSRSAMSELKVDVVDSRGRVLTDPGQVHGSVDPNVGVYIDGTVVTLTAHPDPNYGVAEWTGTDDDDSAGLTNTVTMNGDRRVTVRFEQLPKHKLIVKVVGNGTVEPNGGEFYESKKVPLTAHPAPGHRVKQWIGTDNDPSWNQNTNTVTMGWADTVVTVVFEPDRTSILHVPIEYATLDEAVQAASYGDTQIILSPGVHTITTPTGIDLAGKNITITSADPNNPETVRATVLDCAGTRYTPRRAFYFHSGETGQTVITGVTIRNGYWVGDVGYPGVGIVIADPNAYDPNNADTIRYAMGSGGDASGIGYGGAILCENGSSPTFRNCIIEKCAVVGAAGGDGLSGYSVAGDTHGYWGGNGGNADGQAYGGAVACLAGSKPKFVNCTFSNCTARGAIGGIGGNGSVRVDGGGNESWGGNGGTAIGDGHGGAVYCENGSDAVFEDCVFANSIATTGLRGTAGLRGGGSELPDPYAHPALNGVGGSVVTRGTVVGGAVYQVKASPNFVDCRFVNNSAYASFRSGVYVGLFEDEESEIQVYTRGGAIAAGLGTTVALQGCEFQKNLSGAVYVEGGSVVDVNDCSFGQNQAMGMPAESILVGYDYAIINGQLVLSDPNSLQLVSEGGALYVGPNCPTVRMYSSDFHSNSAVGSGGAVRLFSDANLVDCSFAGNKAGENGGAFGGLSSHGRPGPSVQAEREHDQLHLRQQRRHPGLLWLRRRRPLRRVQRDADRLLLPEQPRQERRRPVRHERHPQAQRRQHQRQRFDRAQRGQHQPRVDQRLERDLFGLHLRRGDGYRLPAARQLPPREPGRRRRRRRRPRGCGGRCDDRELHVHAQLGRRHPRRRRRHQLLRRVRRARGEELPVRRQLRVPAGRRASTARCTRRRQSPTARSPTTRRSGWAARSSATGASDVTVSDSIFKSNSKYAVAEEDFGKSVVKHSLFYANPDGDYGLYDSATGKTATSAGADLHATNTVGNPLFVDGPLGEFYLSQAKAGQAQTSPAVDAGSASATDAAWPIGRPVRTASAIRAPWTWATIPAITPACRSTR